MRETQAIRGGPGPAHWAVPAALALGAPAAVVAALVVTSDVLVTFVVYHVAACLVAPVAVDRARGYSWRELAQRVGLDRPSTEGWAAGLMTGVAMAALVLAPYIAIGDILLARIPLATTLAGWGVPLEAEVLLFLYMLVFNSAAEELFWRGYLQTEAVGRLGPRLGILSVSMAFTSYHVYTIQSLARDWRLAAAGAVGVFAASLVWAFLRRRYESVWPAVLSHVCATAGYMTVMVMAV